jgi:WD40 repeat protein
MLADESVSIYNRQSGGGPFTTTPTDPGNGLQNQNALAWSPDGKYLATSQANGEIQIWDASLDANTGTPLGTYQTHNAQITTLAWSPDNSKRIVGGDNTGNIWVLTAM